jgi:hypothetical protein
MLVYKKIKTPKILSVIVIVRIMIGIFNSIVCVELFTGLLVLLRVEQQLK